MRFPIITKVSDTIRRYAFVEMTEEDALKELDKQHQEEINEWNELKKRIYIKQSDDDIF